MTTSIIGTVRATLKTFFLDFTERLQANVERLSHRRLQRFLDFDAVRLDRRSTKCLL